MKAVLSFLFAVSTLTSVSAFAEVVRLGTTLISPRQDEVIAEGHDLQFNELGVALRGMPGDAMWINEVYVSYVGGPLRKLVNVNRVVHGQNVLWIQVPNTGKPVHRLYLETTPAGITEDATVMFFGR